MKTNLVLLATLFLAGCGKGLPISKYDAQDIVKAGGGVTVSAGEMSKYDIQDIAKQAVQSNGRVVVVDSGNLSKYDMIDIAKVAPGLVVFED